MQAFTIDSPCRAIVYAAGGSTAESQAVTHYLISKSNPGGKRSEQILSDLRADFIERIQTLSVDPRPEARKVLDNNIRILTLLSEAIHLAEENTRILDVTAEIRK
jgi:hypothetical protein